MKINECIVLVQNVNLLVKCIIHYLHLHLYLCDKIYTVVKKCANKKDKQIDARLQNVFFCKNEGTLYLACNDKKAFFFFFSPLQTIELKIWSCQNVCDAFSYRLDNIYIRFGNKFYRQIVGIPMVTHCATLVVDLFLFASNEIS